MKMAPIMSYARVKSRPGCKGVCIGPYETLHTFGKDPLHTNILVRHILTNKLYNMKVIDMCYLKTNVCKSTSVHNELHTLQNLYHSGLVSVYEVYNSASHIFMITEASVGIGIMDATLSCRGIDEHAARKIFRQVVDVVSLCHGFGVYHREITPECILLSPTGDIKVAGFGFSCMKDYDNPHVPTETRSLHFTAPEVWTSSGDEYDGAKADAFSLGVLLFMLLTNKSPFEEACELGVLGRVNSCSVTYPLHFSQDVVDLLGKLIERDPAKRWTLGMVKLHPWYIGHDHFAHAGVVLPRPTKNPPPHVANAGYVGQKEPPTKQRGSKKWPSPAAAAKWSPTGVPYGIW